MLVIHAMAVDEHGPFAMGEQALVRAGTDYLSEHLAECISIWNLARQLETDERRLSDAFLTILGMTPGEYHLQERMRRAQRLLMQTSLAITEIAQRIGFSHPAHFSAAFGEYFGVTPWSCRGASYVDELASSQGALRWG